ncbi:hypothetical protein Mal48_13900 [Thalassoglobus polymorphus]|uniref:Uncharacterized protein n=2 Tax=Thalassoglobus polymorphus TaxID=2527994 RepID=A0A517QKH3_9PLAN|nr:hypothetical protein Mal48_13900 [Thalassoglobus polymorphus]
MGLIMTGSMHVAAASRLGAKLAAETVGLDASTTAATAVAIRGPVDDYLENAGYGPDATEGVRLQHNIGTNGGSAESGTCPEQNTPALPNPPTPAPHAVRVVVCVALPTVSPNLLKTFGFNTENLNLELATTHPYENQ